ncbi:hypothetical protein [Chondrinema litorale]|uniref:hypothetical protein n=1 Tax=Chondrinema litorale TaxID=2994555 RepID=UPI0025439BBF|nr:hypothetical protein [Chondrinema litorale]UZR92577.1 hypothetical protein OQ292_11965 [Chondrinema litorale]
MIFFRFNLTAFLFFISFSINAQTVKKIDAKNIETIALDSRGNIHIVKTNQEIAEYSSDGNFVRSFIPENRNLASYLDVSNPFKLFFFFRDFQEILFTDRYYSQLSSINLYQFGFENISCASPSRNGDLWLLEEGINEVYRYSLLQHQKILNFSIKQHLSKTEYPNYIKEVHHYLVVSTNQSIHFLDQTGNEINNFEKPVDCIAEYVSDNLIWMATKNEIKQIDTNTLKTKKTVSMQKPVEHLLYNSSNNKLLIFSEGSIYFYNATDLFQY